MIASSASRHAPVEPGRTNTRVRPQRPAVGLARCWRRCRQAELPEQFTEAGQRLVKQGGHRLRCDVPPCDARSARCDHDVDALSHPTAQVRSTVQRSSGQSAWSTTSWPASPSFCASSAPDRSVSSVRVSDSVSSATLSGSGVVTARSRAARRARRRRWRRARRRRRRCKC